jgi:hypothetical protein
MNFTTKVSLLLSAACLSIPTLGTAQQAVGTADSDWWDWALPKVQIQIGDDSGKQAGKDKSKGAKSNPGKQSGSNDKGVPAFCRSGAGHPVHGWQWCVDRSYKMGWRSIDVSGAEFKGRDRYRKGDLLDALGVEDVLGRDVTNVIRGTARDLGLEAAINGRWTGGADGGALVLQLRAGNEPLAELTDETGDGRVDATLVMEP